MSPDKEQKLYEDYPELFAEKDLNQTKTCMCWGIGCGDGWEDILTNLCLAINNRLARSARRKKYFPWEDEVKEWLNKTCRKIEKYFKLPHNTLYVPNRRYYEQYPAYKFTFSQIKEKFGTLRVYYNFKPGYVDSDIEDLDPKDIKSGEQQLMGYIDGAIAIAEYMSAITCKACGARGGLTRGGWINCPCNKRN